MASELLNTFNNTNATAVDTLYMLPGEFRWILLCFYVVIICTSIGGNCIVCYSVYTMQSFRTVTNFFIVSLAVTDIMMTCLCVPFTVLSNLVFNYWPFGYVMCPFVGYVQLVSVLQRALTLVALTCDRYYVTRKPLNTKLNKTQAKCLILSLWLSALIIALPTALHSKIIYLQYEPGSLGLCMELWSDLWMKHVYGVIILILQYFLPLVLMTVTYIHIGVIVWAKRPPGEADASRDSRLAVSKRKTVKMIIAVVASYMLCWLPLHVITLVGDSHPEIFDHKYVHMIWLCAHWLAFSNSGINPIIYFWMNSKFRQGFLHVYGVICCKRNHKLNRDSFRMMSNRSYTDNYNGSKRHDVPETFVSEMLSSTPIKNLNTAFKTKENCIKM